MFKFPPTLTVEALGLPRQPVPLRFAWLVTRLPFEIFLTMLARGPETLRTYLYVYDKSPTARGAQDDPQAREPLNRLVSPEYLQKMLASFAGGFATDETAEAQLKRLPTWTIVFTDELVEAVTQFDIDSLGRDAAQARPRTLWWQRPDSTDLNGLIADCIDSGKPARARKTTTGKTTRERRKSTTHKRYRRWQEDYAKLKKENPEQTDSWISNQILKLEQKCFDEDPAKTGRVRSVGTIVKNMKLGKNSLAKKIVGSCRSNLLIKKTALSYRSFIQIRPRLTEDS